MARINLSDLIAESPSILMSDPPSGAGSPEGVVNASPGLIYADTTNGKLYVKRTGTANTGWVTAQDASTLFPPVVKLADQTVNNNAVDVDDAELVLDIAVNEVWQLEWVLFVECGALGATSDFKVGITMPAGATVIKGVIGPSTGATVATGASAANRALGAGTSQSVGTLDSGLVAVVMKAVVTNGANAGTVKAVWSQNSAQVSNTTVKAGSYLVRSRVSPF